MFSDKNEAWDEISPDVTPAELGYAMPAEWEPHEATWIAWPHKQEDWPGKFAPVPWVFAEIVRLLAQGERVHVLVQPSKGDRFAKGVREILAKADVNLAHVTLHQQPTDRVWMRDNGPVFLTRKRKTQNAKRKTSLMGGPSMTIRRVMMRCRRRWREFLEFRVSRHMGATTLVSCSDLCWKAGRLMSTATGAC